MSRRGASRLLLLFALLLSPAAVAGSLPDRLSETAFEHVVQPGDYLIKVSARYGMAAKILADDNALTYPSELAVGDRLKILSRHIVPSGLTDGLLINLPQRMLFHFRDGELVGHYPIGAGRPDWPTRTGDFTVTNLQVNKAWFVPKSIQEEMRREGKAVVTQIRPGPDNPLGKHWIGLSMVGYGIHSTIAPASVFHFQSHGCIRMHPEQIESLFGRITIGTPGRIVYRSVLLAQLPDGRVFAEFHRDIYRRDGDPLRMLRRLATEHELSDRIDWSLAEIAAQRRTGQATEITLPAKGIGDSTP